MLELLNEFKDGFDNSSSSTTAAGHRKPSAKAHSDEEMSSSVGSDAGDTLESKLQEKKIIIGSHQEWIHIAFTHYPKGHHWYIYIYICKITKSTRARCKTRWKKRKRDTKRSEKFGDLITEDHDILIVGNESRCGHAHALVVQEDYTSWIYGYPMKKMETTTYLQRFLPPNQKPGIIPTDNSEELVTTCQGLQWHDDTSTPHRSETNGVAESAVRTVKEGTAVVLVQVGLPVERKDCAMECCCYLRNLQDKMADGQTAIGKRSVKVSVFSVLTVDRMYTT